MNTSQIMMCNISQTNGNLSNCSYATGELDSSWTDRLIMNSASDNIFINTDSGDGVETLSCPLSNLDGSIGTCIPSGYNDPTTGLSFNPQNTSLYFIYYGMIGSIQNNQFCSYDPSSDLLSNCNSSFASESALASTTDITFPNTNYVFVTTTDFVYSCSVNSNGTLSNCNQLTNSVQSAEAITSF